MNVHSFQRLLGQALANALNEPIRDPDGNIFFAIGSAVPADNAVGYSYGGFFMLTGVAAGTAKMYQNKGTAALADFNLMTVA